VMTHIQHMHVSIARSLCCMLELSPLSGSESCMRHPELIDAFTNSVYVLYNHGKWILGYLGSVVVIHLPLFEVFWVVDISFKAHFVKASPLTQFSVLPMLPIDVSAFQGVKHCHLCIASLQLMFLLFPTNARLSIYSFSKPVFP
jgi:hypothetical protein